MTTPEALRELGAMPDLLSGADKERLDRDGFILFPDVLSRSTARLLAARLDELAALKGDQAGRDFQTEAGTTRLGSFVNKDARFDVCFSHPPVLAAVAHVMGDDFGLSSITGRVANAGEGHQALHRDSSHRSANALWILSDFSEQNGATRLVLGSHLFPRTPAEAMDDPHAPHPDEIKLVAPAGTPVVINGYIWHGGTRNQRREPRHLVSAFWTPRGLYQECSDRLLSASTASRLSVAQRYVLDHDMV